MCTVMVLWLYIPYSVHLYNVLCVWVEKYSTKSFFTNTYNVVSSVHYTSKYTFILQNLPEAAIKSPLTTMCKREDYIWSTGFPGTRLKSAYFLFCTDYCNNLFRPFLQFAYSLKEPRLPLWGSSITSMTHEHSVGLHWTRDRRGAKTCTWQHTTLTRDRHPPTPPEGFEPAIKASVRPQNHALDLAASGTGNDAFAICHLKVIPFHSVTLITNLTKNASDLINWSTTNPIPEAVLSIDVEDTQLVKKLMPRMKSETLVPRPQDPNLWAQ